MRTCSKTSYTATLVNFDFSLHFFRTLHGPVISNTSMLIAVFLLTCSAIFPHLSTAASISGSSIFMDKNLKSFAFSSDLRQQSYFNLNVFKFINHLTHIGVRNGCDSRILQSDVLRKIQYETKSLISSCHSSIGVPCRLAMSQAGLVYSVKEFNLDTIWTRVNVDNEKLSRNKQNKHLVGAFYIKFVLANQYMCINKNAEIYASVDKVHGCQWAYRASQLVSAHYKKVNLVITKKCEVSVERTKTASSGEITSLRAISNYQQQSCSNSLNETSGYSSQLQKFMRSCSDLETRDTYRISNHNSNHVKNQPHHMSTTTSASRLASSKFNFINYNNKNSQFSMSTKEPVQSQWLDMSNNYSNNFGGEVPFKKCLKYRNTPSYKPCMKKYYRCFKYSNDPEKLKKCRKNNRIIVPPAQIQKKRLFFS